MDPFIAIEVDDDTHYININHIVKLTFPEGSNISDEYICELVLDDKTKIYLSEEEAEKVVTLLYSATQVFTVCESRKQ